MAKQSIDPALLALQTAKKAMPASPSTQAVAKPSLNVKKQQPQAISTNITPPVAKIGGISSPFWATNINSSVMWWATPQEIGTRAKELQSLPKVMPATWSEPVKKLSIDDFAMKIKEKYPEYKDKDNKTLAEAMIKKYPEYQDKVELNQPTTTQNIAWWLVQSATWLPSLWAKIANPIFWAVDKYIVDPLSRALWVDEAKIQANTASAKQARSNIIWWLETAGQKLTWWDPESTAFKTAKLVGDIWQTALTPTTPWLTKWAWLLKWAGQLALQWAWETLKYSAIADQRLPTKEELAYWVGGNVIIGWAIAWAPKAIKAIKSFKPIESIARKVTWTADDYGKLFKSAEPRTNQLNKAVDYKNLQKNHNIAAEEIVKAWYKPVDTASRAEAHANTMKKIRKEEIESKIGNNFRINLNPVADKIDEFVAKQKTAWLLKNKWQLAELKAQADKFRKMWEVDWADWEFIKEMLNSQINNRWDASLGDVYKNWLKEATKTLWQSLDDTFSAIPWQFAEAKKRFWALKATYQDVVKADIKAQKAKWLWLGETFWRIEWIGDIIWAVGWLVTWKNPLPQLASWFSKLAVWKVLAKIKDKDFLIQEWFEWLSKKIPVTNTINISKKGTQLWLPLLKQTTKAPTAITPSWVIQQTPVAPKPTLKTPPITVEKWAIGMWTPKVNKAPVIPPKTTVAPSVSAPKVDIFARMTELDSNPLYKKISFQETNYWRNAKWLETEFWTIQKVNVDNRYNPQSYTIDGVQYPTSQINNFRKKQTAEAVAQAKKASKAISDLKAIESWKGNRMWSSLRSVLDDLWIKDVNSIPEWTEQDILQLVRARNPLPKKWK